MPLLAGAEPYHRDGGPVGVVLCHGLTGSPASMRPWAEHLAGGGLTVSVPRLPGHGTGWEDLAVTRWSDWYGELCRAVDRIDEQCEQVFVAGLSMGGTLTIRLAQERGDRLAGIVLVNPSLLSKDPRAALLPVVSRVWRSRAGIGGDIKKPHEAEPSYARTPLRALDSLRQLWGVTRPQLARITLPVLLFHSRVDHVVEPVNSQVFLDGIRSSDVTDRVLEDSYHVATMDNDAPAIFGGSLDWIRARSGIGPDTGAGARSAPQGTEAAGVAPGAEVAGFAPGTGFAP